MHHQKRRRGENWSYDEKEILRQVIEKSIDVIEDKSAKSSVINLKKEEWKNITKKFNEISWKNRAEEEIKLAWKRLKLADKSSISRRDQNDVGSGTTSQSPSSMDFDNTMTSDFNTVEVNDSDSDSMILETVKIQPGIVPDPGPSSEGTPRYNIELKVENIEDPEEPEHYGSPQIIDESEDQHQQFRPRNGYKTNNKVKNKRLEDMREKVVQSSIEYNERRIQMLEVEHKQNVKIAQLQIKKLELEISLLENKLS